MKKTSKILFLFTLIVLGVMMAFSVSAATAVDGIYYDLNDSNSTAAVSGTNRNSCTVENVVIPSEITVDGKTYTVTSLSGSSFGEIGSGNASIKSITIPYTVTVIGERSFQCCRNIASVTIENTEEHPSQLTFIGMNTFWGCSSLTSIAIPKSVETIKSETSGGSGTFRGCSNLSSVVFERGSALKVLEWGMFIDCRNLKELVLPQNLTTINGEVFTNIKFDKITLPNTITSIASNAFNSAPVAVEYEGTEEDWNEFKNLSSFLSIASDVICDPCCYGNHVYGNFTYDNEGEYAPTCIKTGFGTGICIYCNSASAQVEVPALGHDFSETEEKAATCTEDGYFRSICERCGEYIQETYPATGHSYVYTYVLPGLNEGGTMTKTCKNNCGNIETAEIPAGYCGVLKAEENGTPVLEFLSPETVFTINNGVLTLKSDYKSTIYSAVIPQNAIEIGNGTFQNSSIVNVIISDSVKVLQMNAFNSCKELVTVEISENSKLEEIGDYVFRFDSKLESIYLPKNLKMLGSGTKTDGGVFDGCSSLKSVVFSSEITELTTITYSAFSGTAITEITLPNCVTTVGARAFQECKSLTYVNLGASFRSFYQTSGHVSTFYQCNSLKTVVMPAGVTVTGDEQYIFNDANGTLNFKYTGTLEQFEEFRASFGNNNGKIKGATVEIITVCEAFYNNQHLTPNDDGDCSTALVCERCGTVLLEAKEHNLVTVVVDATCTTDEMTHQYCTNEGCNYKTEPQKTADALGHNTTTTLTYANGFDKDGEKVTVCSRCDYNETVVLNPIFKAKGYSVKEDGTAIMGGFTVNATARDEYNTYAETPIVYGAIFANVNDGSDIIFDADNKITNEKAIQVEVIDQDYGAFNYTIKGFNLENATANVKFVITAYVIDNGEISFVQANKVGDSAFDYAGNVNDGKLGFTTLTDIYASSEYANKEEVVA